MAIMKCKKAHEIFTQKYSSDSNLNNFISFHNKTLIDKGFVPNPDLAAEKNLPSATYIIRTGGKHRHFLERTLDCLVAQQYPDLRALLVIHKEFEYIDEIIAKYPSLKIKVVKSIKSMRSEAICHGMAAIETELFGLFDDDDEIFPNHVRMLVKALQYHDKRDWRGEMSMVYSGSIHADDTYTVPERAEFRDIKLMGKDEKRAIEHFRFYSSIEMSQHLWYMPNAWLARSKFIDNELLTDPRLDTCEDLYFELQLAQRGQFVFSAEVTAIHHFHHFGNSTIVDNHKHFPDTQRIALRNFTRTFPKDIVYDGLPGYRLIGIPSAHDPNYIRYQDVDIPKKVVDYASNQFFPYRNNLDQLRSNKLKNQLRYIRNINLGWLIFLSPFVAVKYTIKFFTAEREMKRMYISKFRANVQSDGLIISPEFLNPSFKSYKTWSNGTVSKSTLPIIDHLLCILYRLIKTSLGSSNDVLVREEHKFKTRLV